MQERAVTLLGTAAAAQPVFVLASLPIELEGTYPLPEAQLDRFLFKLIVPVADIDVLDRIVATRRRGEAPASTWKLSAQELERLFAVMDRIFLPKPVARYIARLVAATHPQAAEAPDAVKQYVGFGGRRRAIALAEACRAAAASGPADGELRGRPHRGGGGPQPPPDPELQGPARPHGCPRHRPATARRPSTKPASGCPPASPSRRRPMPEHDIAPCRRPAARLPGERGRLPRARVRTGDIRAKGVRPNSVRPNGAFGWPRLGWVASLAFAVAAQEAEGPKPIAKKQREQKKDEVIRLRPTLEQVVDRQGPHGPVRQCPRGDPDAGPQLYHRNGPRAVDRDGRLLRVENSQAERIRNELGGFVEDDDSGLDQNARLVFHQPSPTSIASSPPPSVAARPATTR